MNREVTTLRTFGEEDDVTQRLGSTYASNAPIRTSFVDISLGKTYAG